MDTHQKCGENLDLSIDRNYRVHLRTPTGFCTSWVILTENHKLLQKQIKVQTKTVEICGQVARPDA